VSDAVSPLAPAAFPQLAPLAGVRLATHACGIRYQGRTDLLLVEMAPGTSVAGVYTRSLTRSAPVDWCRQAQANGSARVLIVNSGNANAFTGTAGIASVERTVAGAV
jgi:glutamate N-acetyltransferase/amino-acid N-acetyltransferase